MNQISKYRALFGAKNCLKYEWHLNNVDRNISVSMAVGKMADMPSLVTYFSRVQKMKSLMGKAGL